MTLHRNVVADIYARYGLTGAEGPEHLKSLAGILRDDPAYADQRHPGRPQLVQDLNKIYEQLHPNPEPDTAIVNGRMVDLNAPRGGQ
jgi:hypothetical protein